MIDVTMLKAALPRWADALKASAPELNALDGRVGDGDLGATLEKCAANVEAALPSMPDDLAGVLKACAQACAKASGSSFGTLMAVAFISASKQVEGRNSLTRTDLATLLDGVLQALSARGGAKPGDKTMLDSIASIAQALTAAADGANLRLVAREAAQRALDEYRQQPNRIGRARMFAEKTIGMDDPGMVGVLRMVEAI